MSKKQLTPDEEERWKKTEQSLKIIFENPNLETYFLLALNPMPDRVQTALSLDGLGKLAPAKQGAMAGCIAEILASLIRGVRLRLSDEDFAEFMYGLHAICGSIRTVGVGFDSGPCQHDLIEGRCWKCGHKA